MQEVLRRERTTHMMEWEMNLLAMGTLMGMAGKDVVKRVELFRKELEKYESQEAFGLEATVKRLRRQLYDVKKDERLLARLENL
jgi:DNA-binding winged helix-turn-helix (wHTH) protein